MATCKIIEFAKEKGFGRLELEDGSILNFDAGALSRFDAKPGDTGEVEFREIRGRKIVSRVSLDD